MSSFKSTVIALWLRLSTIGTVASAFALSLWLARGTAQGWSYYLTISEVAFEILVRLIFFALAAMVLALILTAALAPLLWFFSSSRERVLDWATKIAVFAAVFLDSRYALHVLIQWSYQVFNHRAVLDKVVTVVFYLIFFLALIIPRARKQVVTSLDGFLTEKMTRRAAIATVAGTAAIVAVEFAFSKRLPAALSAPPSPHPRPNFLLVTFDALSAEDMSLYGYGLSTTPNIDAFARSSSVFNNFYSACTFTTPCVAAIMTGLYPSESGIYQMQGQVRPEDLRKTLPHLLGSAGYPTGGFFSNPNAYFLAVCPDNGFNILPEPVFYSDDLQKIWRLSGPLHQNSGFGSRLDEYDNLRRLWSAMTGAPADLQFRFRASASFAHAQEILADLPKGFFLWIHVITPHNPYLPDAADRGRFLPDDQLRTFEHEEDRGARRWFPHYAANQQDQVDKRRLAYDEFIATADRDFGSFMAELKRTGRLEDTTVIVSADHGESFQGGVYQHDSPYLTRPVIHVPLIIRTAGQQEGRTIYVTADQTSLAPTILELGGVPIPPSMRGPSLVPWLNGEREGKGEGCAFSQYLERNSVFKPLHRGSVGVIEGEYQYVVYIENQLSVLRPLAQAQHWDLDSSMSYPETARALRETLRARFPDLVHA